MNQQRIIPLKDSRILTSLEGALVVLWVIDDQGPITFGKLLETLFVNPTHTDLRSTALLNVFNAMRGLVDAVRYLHQCGLVELDLEIFAEAERQMLLGNFKMLADPYTGMQLKVSGELNLLREMFDLDLQAYAAGKQ